jgi:hypothetical protein
MYLEGRSRLHARLVEIGWASERRPPSAFQLHGNMHGARTCTNPPFQPRVLHPHLPTRPSIPTGRKSADNRILRCCQCSGLYNCKRQLAAFVTAAWRQVYRHNGCSRVEYWQCGQSEPSAKSDFESAMHRRRYGRRWVERRRRGLSFDIYN